MSVADGLLVDQPRSGDSGNRSVDFLRNRFCQPKLRVLELIKRFVVILVCISCGFEVNFEAFNSFALQTAESFVALYQ